ncbi:MAG: DEAD/DEAH box helicase family protein [Acidimicrobiia bacterium]|nr:DEAD/DEAH box helicase family protein [Acidimicrobiia bacterium]
MPRDDLHYWPDLDDWAKGDAPRRILVVGAHELEPGEAELRRAPVLPLAVPMGSYRFTDATGVDVLVIADGESSEPMAAPYSRIEDRHPLAQARATFNHLWGSAEPVGPPSGFERGATVAIEGSGDVGVVTDVRWDGDRHRYTVNVMGASAIHSEEGLRLFRADSIDPHDWVMGPVSNASDVALLLTLTKLSHPLTDTIYSYLSSKTVFRPYQFRPVLKILSSTEPRLLIADEVGLGKTIEAGLIWTELEARSRSNRVLIVCPAALVLKWKAEMERRFNRRVRLVDRGGLDELVDLFRGGHDEIEWVGVVSLERLRTATQLEALQQVQPAFDLVIVDEAHYLRNQATRSFEAGELLSDWADALVFLSATPINLGEDDLFNLLRLLRPDEYEDKAIFQAQLEPNQIINGVAGALIESRTEPALLASTLERLGDLEFGAPLRSRPEYRELHALLKDSQQLSGDDIAEARRLLGRLHVLGSVVSRTRKVDVPDAKAVRQAVPIEVDWLPEERGFYEAVRAWTWARASALGVPPGFAMQMPLRQAASCIPVAVSKLEANEDFGFDFDDDDHLGVDEILEDADELDLTEIRQRATAMQELVGQGVDSKYSAFLQTLRGHRSGTDAQVMVFSFFVGTLEYLGRRLAADGFSVAVMHGQTPVEERARLMEDFRAGDFEVLLLSEVGSEGLDFEFCNVVVNYDLPWNPMRVEQRIGRVDRFGQQSEKIFVWNFHVPGTIETDILDRLYQRIGVFERSIGPLEPILRSPMVELQQTLFDPGLTEHQRKLRLDEIEVAVVERSKDLADLEQADGQLGAIDSLLVDGLDDGIDRGRFIGRREIEDLLRAYFRGTRAKLRLDQEGTGVLQGDEDLADQLVRAQVSRTGSRYSFTDLTDHLRNGDEIRVTTSNEHASRHDVELLSLRHPLVRAAVKALGESASHRKGRVGTMSIVDDGLVGSYLILCFLMQTTGAQPALELVTVAVDAHTGQIVPDVGDRLLAALATGEWSEGHGAIHEDLLAGVNVAVAEMHRIQEVTAERRRASNAAYVEARQAAVRSSTANKVARSQAQLEEQRNEAIRKLHKGRIRNLRADQDTRIAKLEDLRQVSVNVTPVAMVGLTVKAS